MTDLRKPGATFLRVLSGCVGVAVILIGGVLLLAFMVAADSAWELPIAALCIGGLCGPFAYLLIRFAARRPKSV